MRCADPWFVASDVCKCLELGNVSQTCSRLDDDERGIISNDTPSGKQEMLVGSSRSGSLLGLLHRRERDSRFFTNDEIILGNFKGNDSLPLANRGNTFVSLRGF